MSFAVKPLPFDATRIAGLSEHRHSLADGRPILALDIYEHSYHLDYGAKAAAYIDAFMKAISWDGAGRRLAGESTASLALAAS